MTTLCPNCGAPNRPSAKFCANCRHALIPRAQSGADWLTQVHRTLALAWAQTLAEVRGVYDEWIAQRPVTTGIIVASLQTTQVQIVLHGLFGPVPVSGGTSQQSGLTFPVQDAQTATTRDVVMIGAYSGDVPQSGDVVSVFGQWDAGMNAYRAWRVRITQRGGQAVTLELTTGRPVPLALLSLALSAFVLLACACSVCVRLIWF